MPSPRTRDVGWCSFLFLSDISTPTDAGQLEQGDDASSSSPPRYVFLFIVSIPCTYIEQRIPDDQCCPMPTTLPHAASSSLRQVTTTLPQTNNSVRHGQSCPTPMVLQVGCLASATRRHLPAQTPAPCPTDAIASTDACTAPAICQRRCLHRAQLTRLPAQTPALHRASTAPREAVTASD